MTACEAMWISELNRKLEQGRLTPLDYLDLIPDEYVPSKKILMRAISKKYGLVPGGVYECCHCGSISVIWDCDHDYKDLDYNGEGIVRFFYCTNCGADIEYRIPFDSEEGETDGKV